MRGYQRPFERARQLGKDTVSLSRRRGEALRLHAVDQIDFTDPSVQAAAAALGTALVGAAVLISKGLDQSGDLSQASSQSSMAPSLAPKSVTDAVGVFGATGKTGREIVKSVVQEGRDVVAFVRDKKKGEEVFKDLMGASGGSIVFRNADVTNEEKLVSTKDKLMKGVTQLVMALGPVYGKSPDGAFGPIDGMTPEAVDYKGVSNVVKLAQSALTPMKAVTAEKVFDMSDVSAWTTIDDVIMGGTSQSKIEASGSALSWSGKVISEGGGFCGLRTKDFENTTLSLQDYDALKIRLKGDGNRYKMTIALRDGYTRYQHPFDTQKGVDQDIVLNFEDFVGLQTSNANFVNYSCIPLSQADRSDVAFVNLVVSKFEFNGYSNAAGTPEEFSLTVSEIQGIKKPKPQLVLVTSASCERNSRLMNAEEREADIPIVKLNPNGILNWKYKGEYAVRDSGFPYSIVRPCGLTTQNETDTFNLELQQGDFISGAISRNEVASLVNAALSSHLSTGKTFEARRAEAKVVKTNDPLGKTALLNGFQNLVTDYDRHLRGLPVLAPPVDPPAEPLSEEEQTKVLNDPRVKEQRKREPGAQQVAGRDDAEKASPAFVVYRNGQVVT
eukprot:CAMPEP_0184491850 /NCGR_PEP_ID=MMETSP0113_2-20130426/21511_1 /TAXON_ID=91329 /ORGANISM="Norrisiella sphaerica, Strain BC52" /LENGTH=612 /DNA_ID=CAMNT_0026876391 /DNA_START=454 /DNA_END=2292 /DNA_ORIENTATION=-